MEREEYGETPPEAQSENVEIDKEAVESAQLQQGFTRAVERSLLREWQEESPEIPKEKRRLEVLSSSEGREVGKIERVRIPKRSHRTPSQDLWLVIDFDDVLLQTSTLMRDLKERLRSIVGAQANVEDVFDALYKNSYRTMGDGKRVFQYDEFVKKLSAAFPDHAENVQKILLEPDYSQYIDPAVKRALLALRSRPGYTIRMSVLTFGDSTHQKKKVDASGILAIVDEAIYTEGSKREVVEVAVEKEYPDFQQEGLTDYPYEGKHRPFIMTIDDSPEQVKDFEALPFASHYANVRFHHPQAKRYAAPHEGKRVVLSEETDSNEAALRLFHIAAIAVNEEVRWHAARYYDVSEGSVQRSHSDRSLEARMMSDEEWLAKDYRKYYPSFPDEDIRYYREAGRTVQKGRKIVQEPEQIVREWTHYPTPKEWPIWGPGDYADPPEFFDTKQFGEQRRWVVPRINPDGTLPKYSYTFDAEEFIRTA